MRVLILDDDNSRHQVYARKLMAHKVIHTYTTEECIDALKNRSKFDYCFLDHDLGGDIYVPSGKNTGYEVAEWLMNNQEYMPDHIVIHSLNPAGVTNMKSCLPDAEVIPFAWNKIKDL